MRLSPEGAKRLCRHDVVSPLWGSILTYPPTPGSRPGLLSAAPSGLEWALREELASAGSPA